ncbi:MAG: hypothetical protein HOV86_02810 [Thermoactinospora sp.]|nr:hypothetical protein [Thermoactinospora sp.]
MRWLGYACGAALIVLGLGGLAVEGALLGWALWFGGVLAVHDGLLMPGVLLVGTVVSRWRLAAILCGSVTIATLPTVPAIGRRPDNPSILPLNYPLNLLLVLGATLVLALAVDRFSRSDRPA